MNHGGDIWTYGKIGELVDFSSNINPLGYPEGLLTKILEDFDSVHRYPDIQYRALRGHLSEYLGADPENIVVGNGAMELIDGILTSVKRVLIPVPSFVEYELRAHIHGLEMVFLPMDKQLRPMLDIWGEYIRESRDASTALVIANPSNPTGYVFTEEQMLELIDLCQISQVELILDETFVEFTDVNYDTIQIASVFGFEGVSVIRAATKFFGIPGLRLGYGVTSSRMKAFLDQRLNPWSVNALAEIAGSVLFQDRKYIDQTKQYIRKERSRMLNALSQLTFLKPYASDANFILLKLHSMTAVELFEGALTRGLLLRTCDNYRGLDHHHIRVAVKSRSDNERLLQYLQEVNQIGK
ncbi:MAG: pyridoxal phosphate-dependent class II aminotransferase [Tissierellia bacterium]|nr:pyridoxal phosphate-dependent class II aminotransferase [Tissierellia bacterium]